jgi:cysteine synthase A
MENMNPGGTGKDRAAMSMILAAEKKGELPPPLKNGKNDTSSICHLLGNKLNTTSRKDTDCNNNNPTSIHNSFAIASISSSRGHGVIVVMPDDQSSQKREFLERLGCGVVVVKNCSISNPGHYVNVAKRIWEWIEGERRYDEYLWISLQCNCEERNGRTATKSDIPKLIKAAFMNQFENLANLHSHYTTTGPEIFHQLHGEVDAFVMSAGTGGTIVGVGGYLKDNYWYKQHASSTGNHRAPPRVVLVDPPGSSLYNKVKFGVAFAPQQSEQKLRRHRYDTLAEGKREGIHFYS